MNFIFSSFEYYSGETKKKNSRKNNYVWIRGMSKAEKRYSNSKTCLKTKALEI